MILDIIAPQPHVLLMIKSIRHRGLRRWWTTGNASGINADWLLRLTRLINRLHSATQPTDMDLPGWHFHALTGNKAGRYAVRITSNWRLTFAFEGEHAVRVDLEDYH